MKRDVVIVCGGMAGLTVAAFLCKAGLGVTLLEKERRLGGLVNSFERGGLRLRRRHQGHREFGHSPAHAPAVGDRARLP